MNITINAQYKDGVTEVYETFWFDEERSRFETKEQKFSHILWNDLISQEFGDDYHYNGRDIRQGDKLIMSMEDLKDGFSEIRLDDYLYFI